MKTKKKKRNKKCYDCKFAEIECKIVDLDGNPIYFKCSVNGEIKQINNCKPCQKYKSI